jgi:hypothetical protein
MVLEWNWIIFGLLVLVVYFGNGLIQKIFLKGNPVMVKLERDLGNLKRKIVKTIPEQKKYLELERKRKRLLGGMLRKFLFGILTLIAFSVLLPYFKSILAKLIYLVLWAFIMPLGYIYAADVKNAYKAFNYFAFMLLYVFLGGFFVVQSVDPLMFYGFKITLLVLLPGFFLMNFVVGMIKRRLVKRR